jgi:hypothetical protein
MATKKLVTKKNLKSFTVTTGSHGSPEEGMCVMELVAYMAGEPHSDAPQCACPTIAAGARQANDSGPQWLRDELRDRTFKIIGSKKDLRTQVKRARVFADAAQEIAKLTDSDGAWRRWLQAFDDALAV